MTLSMVVMMTVVLLHVTGHLIIDVMFGMVVMMTVLMLSGWAPPQRRDGQHSRDNDGVAWVLQLANRKWCCCLAGTVGDCNGIRSGC